MIRIEPMIYPVIAVAVIVGTVMVVTCSHTPTSPPTVEQSPMGADALASVADVWPIRVVADTIIIGDNVGRLWWGDDNAFHFEGDTGPAATIFFDAVLAQLVPACPPCDGGAE